jgi:NAD(P)-dependent dehydrogenase (short-subunit alcohol dehydrogenase family)
MSTQEGTPLKGKLVAVLGASGRVGGGVLISLLRAGAFVIAPARSGGSLNNIRSLLTHHFPDDLLSNACEYYIHDYSTPQGASDLASKLKDTCSIRHTLLDAIFISSGGTCTMGPLSALPSHYNDFSNSMKDRVFSQCIMASHLFPLLKPSPNSCYIIVDGRLGEHCTNPNAALYTIVNAAVYGVVLALRKEHEGEEQRIQELRIGAVIRGVMEEEHPSFPGVVSYSALEVGKMVVGMVSGEVREPLVRLNLGQGL